MNVFAGSTMFSWSHVKKWIKFHVLRKKYALAADDSNEILPKNPILYLFVQCVWDPRHGPCYRGHEYKKLESLLETVEQIQYNSLVYRDSENHISPLKMPDNATYGEDFQRKAQHAKDLEILAHIAYRLKNAIHFLNEGKGDVNYECGSSGTILHRFLNNCLEIPVDASISRARKVIESLVKMKAPLYKVNDKGQTTFHIAMLCENQQILQTMISSLTDIEDHDKFGNTALHIIVDNCIDEEGNHRDGYVDFVRILVSKGANVNAKSNDGVTAVHLAAGKFQTDMLKLFMDKEANFDECSNDGQTPLHFTCKSTLKLNNSSMIIETLDFLVAQGCDLTVTDKKGYRLLHYAVEFQSVEIVERLIALGASVDRRSEKTLLTPLYLAARGDKLDNIKALVRAGANVNAEAADDSTPIFMSARLGSYESMQFLIDQGADLHRRDSLMGFTLLHMAASGVDLRPEFNVPPTPQTEFELKILKWVQEFHMLQNDAILKLKSKTLDKQTEKQRNNKLKKLEVLLEKGLDVNDSGIYGVTPLHLAALAPNFDAVKLLLDSGAKVDLPSSRWTALHSASLMKTPDIVEILVARGADVRRRGGTGHWSPIHLAVLHQRMELCPNNIETDDVRLSCPIKELCGYKIYEHVDTDLNLMTTLIKNGADVNAQSASGKTPLHLVKPYHDGVIKKLLKAGAHVNVQDRKGILPVHGFCNYHNDDLFKMLLDYGADINDDDTSELIMKHGISIRNAAIQHAIKLKLIGLPVAIHYRPFIDSPHFGDFYEQCFKEATRLMNHRDDSGFSLYKYLKMKPKSQYQWIKKISDSFVDYQERFPLYAGLIHGACRESAIRMQLLEPARIAWAENSGIDLPDVCVEHILSHLSNRYLKVMATSFEKNYKY